MKKKTFLAVAVSFALSAGAVTGCADAGTKEISSSSRETEETSQQETETEKEDDIYQGLVLYESSSGISLYMEEGFTEDSLEGFVCYFERDDCAMNCQEETFEELQNAGYSSDMSLEEYAGLIAELYQTGTEAITDEYGNVYIVYSQDIDGANFTYYDFFDKGSSSFWSTNFMCLTDEKTSFEDNFKLWASSIRVP